MEENNVIIALPKIEFVELKGENILIKIII